MVRRKTKTQRIKEYLESGNRITPLEAVNMFHTTRLQGIIYSLRENYGMKIRNIQKEWGTKYAIYELED